ncbi:DNA topoisomerase IB [Bradyrhizobium sp. LM2.3]
MMDQQNFGTIRPASADPAAVALAKALGQWPKPAGSARLSPKKAFDTAPAATVEALAKELGLRLGDQNELKIRRIKRGKGYSFVRPNGAHIRDARTIRRLHSMAVPPAYREVRYSADPSSHLQAVGRDAAGRLQYRYHADWEKVREQRKAHRLEKLVGALPKIRRKVSAFLSGEEPTREFALSAVIELIARTAIRPGNESYARLNGTRGATTLLKSNVSLEDDSLVLTFKAKGGKAVRKECDAAKLVRAIGILQGVPGKRMFQYRDAYGVVRAVNTTQVNAFSARDRRHQDLAEGFSHADGIGRRRGIVVADHPGDQPARPQEAGAGSDPRRRRPALQYAGDLPQELCPRHHRHRVRGRHPRTLRRDHEGPALAGQARATFAAGGGDGGGLTFSRRYALLETPLSGPGSPPAAAVVSRSR